ncbi:zinc ABC transporter ATP-binding protein ZnuC [Litoribrevibacter albus]|uniref:Zinc import ATP-binding protein ZnuC n=1 Tax=Litoribrevibacter albus TaxID=1473156 RepID=A0AA37W7P9_9GAMM|nr:zinc ABC transporter ATP-binding protein ZnuC [Litoribrevibacter albus]GLQ32950.1 zinc import ATP-binding protein ZnuC [Litoribrevibacter albus]
MSLLSVSGLSLRIQKRSILDSINFEIEAGQIVTLIGPNGAGKSSLIRCILGLQKYQKGRVSLQPGLKIGYMPQKMHVEQSLPMTVDRFLALGPKTSREQREQALQRVGVANIQSAPLQTISGGEQQRVLLARAMLNRPDLLILDEPAQGVDINGQAELYDLIRSIRDEYGCGVFMVSHDLHLVMSSTDQVLCLNHHICCSGHPDEVTKSDEYISIFGEQRLHPALAHYTHHHDHKHDLHGDCLNGHSKAHQSSTPASGETHNHA